jgi:wobble nucleotide-excising tRNase
VEGGDLKSQLAQLIMLQIHQIRFNPEIATLCDEYVKAKGFKNALEIQKDKAREKLNIVTEEIISRYQEGINSYLNKFGADFRIVEKKTQYRGHTPSVDYKILIGNKTISVGDAETPESEPSFRNTLSDGDRSTLAFAFFMSKLDLDSNVSYKVIILDDPINSLDIHRRRATVQEIVRKANTAKQVIILSHDLVFVKNIYDSFDKSLIKCLSVKRRGTDSNIQEWDIVTETATDYYKSYYVLEKYLEDGSGDLLAIARSIRPVLEGNLRNCFPTIFVGDKWLGDFIKAINDAESTSLLITLKNSPMFDELKAINEYSKDFHHLTFDSTSINPTELMAYATRTIKFLSR